MHEFLENRTVVVTGGSSGFGLAAAGLLLKGGARVAITGRDPERLRRAAAALDSDRLLAVRADATRTEDWRSLLAQVVARFGALDVLVNNHGAGIRIAPLDRMEEDTLRRVLEVNLLSVLNGCRLALPVMQRQGRGHIVNVASACAYHSWPSWSAYTAAKAGLVAFTRCLHLEMRRWGGKATSFIPGAARTGFGEAARIEEAGSERLPGAGEFARSLVHCIDVPENTVIEELNVWGVEQVLTPF